MSHFYVACYLGVENSRVMLGNLHAGKLQVSEIRRFPNVPVVDRKSVQWNIPQLYQELMEALRTIASYQEPVRSISCTSFAGDYLLFDSEGALMTPAVHRSDPQAQANMAKLLPAMPWDAIYEETGTQQRADNMFLQLGAESGKRLRHTQFVLPFADGFNYVLGGEAKMEMSIAGATQLYNPALRQWSNRVLNALKIRSDIFPPIVPAGAPLGNLKEEIGRETGLEDSRLVASCSEATAASLAGLPVGDTENWAFLMQGNWSLMGAPVAQPILSLEAQTAGFNNQPAFDGSTYLHKRGNGLQILAECQRFWEQSDRSIEEDMLSHLAGSAPPFESLIDPSDPRFSEPGDMPLKIQSFCKETSQTIPRKPGPLYRCVLESLALHYRKLLQELEQVTGTTIERVYVLGEDKNLLLNHFTANALQRPVTVTADDTLGLGNIVVQALGLRHIQSIEEARALLRTSCKTQAIVPHAHLWEDAYSRFVSLLPETAAPA